METGLILLSLVVPVLVGHTTTVEDLERMQQAQAYIIEQQRLLEEEQKRQEQKDQNNHESITEGLIERLDSLGRIRYRSGRFDPTDNAFDCSGLIKGYGVLRGILTEEEATTINSTVLYLLSTPKQFHEAKRGDITYWHPLGDYPKHVAIVTKDYDPKEGGLWIIDNAPGSNGAVKERFLQMCGDVFVGKRKVLIGTNPLVEVAKNKALEFEPLRSYQGYFEMTRYYAPEPNQSSYLPYDLTYEDALRRNCGGNCDNMAGKPTKAEDINRTISCPKEYPLKAKFKMMDDSGYERIVTCHDRGGSIKGKKIDLFAGFGEEGYQNLRQNRVPSGSQHLYLFTLHSQPINEPKTKLRIIDMSGRFVYTDI